MKFLAFLARRVLVTVPAVLAVIVITFAMIRLVPGDPVQVIAGTDLDPAVAEQLRVQLGLDKPILVQFWNYFWSVLHGDLGTSYLSHQPVSEIIGQRLPYTLALTAVGVGFGLIISVPIGILAAYRQSKRQSSGMGFTFASTTLAAIPDFLLGTVLVAVFAVWLRWLPVAGANSWESIILPALALGVPLAGVQSRVIRSGVNDSLGQPFVRTMRAAGVSERSLMRRNVIPNASIPAITLLSVEFGRLLAGALIVENIFAWPGLGTTIFTSISDRDLTAVQGQILVVALIILALNLLVDIVYGLVDPRIGLA
jgi:ABC-type dipeptide/oligopeptide/nickel transport system permease component